MSMNRRPGTRIERTGGRASGVGALAAALLALTSPAMGQEAPPEPAPAVVGSDSPYQGRRVDLIRFEGLSRVTEQKVRNQMRTVEGLPYDEETLREDVRRIQRLGEFRAVDVLAAPAPGSAGVEITFTLREAPIIQDVQAVGNRQISDQTISAIVQNANLRSGTPVDDFQVQRARRAIEEEYRNRGYSNVEVTVDTEELEASGVVLFRIREGERIKVTDIRFRGNESIESRRLRPLLRTKTAGIFEKGPIDQPLLDQDVASIVRFYQEQGFLDVRADREIIPSPNGKEAIVVFFVDEGPLYTLRSVQVRSAVEDEPPPLTSEQVIGLMSLKPGDVYGRTAVNTSIEDIQKALWRLGYTDALVRAEELRDPGAASPVVDLLLTLGADNRARVGEVVIAGNTLTQQRVIRRELQDAGVSPDRPLDLGAVREAERRLTQTRLFDQLENPPRVTVQPEQPETPGHRDVLVEVAETDTGALSFGAAVGSDSGLSGIISLNQRNFDLLDFPSSFRELVQGQSFRGAGQQFNILAQPGTELQSYSISLLEPRLFDSDYSAGTEGFFLNREYDDYDEQRYGGRARIGRRFGDRWVGTMSFRAEWVELNDIDPSAPVDVFEVADLNLVTGVGVQMTRTTVPPIERFRPTRGTRLELGVEQVGALGGDFDFTRLTLDHSIFLTVYEDYLGRKGVLSFKTSVGYIPQEDEAPVYERFYLGGRSFRGFEYRTISPKGIRNDTGTLGDDPVGGTWKFFFGVEYEHPIFADVIAAVVFMDTGTVTDTPGFDDYRISVGAGLRLYIQALGNAPLAFDFAFPLASEESDEEEVFSFSVDLPF